MLERLGDHFGAAPRHELGPAFVRELTEGDEGEAIVRALIDVRHPLHARVVGVGIETSQQASLLRELGCDLGQGNYFSPPLPPERMEALPGERRPLLGANAG